MVHPHSLLRYLAGDIESIFVRRNAAVGSSMVSLRFKSGAVGNLHYSASQSSRSFLERTEVIGQGENVIVDNNIRVHLLPQGRRPRRIWPGRQLF